MELLTVVENGLTSSYKGSGRVTASETNWREGESVDEVVRLNGVLIN
jgi:hypothetical protein